MPWDFFLIHVITTLRRRFYGRKVNSGIKQDLIGRLSSAQLEVLGKVLNKHFAIVVVDEHTATENVENMLLPLFIAAKRVEGCSEKTLRYYESTIRNMMDGIQRPEQEITNEDLRCYLDGHAYH